MLGRSTAIRLVARRGTATVTAQAPSIQPIPASAAVEGRKRNERRGSRNPSQNNQISNEQFRLQKKHGETLQSTKFENLHQAVDHIEWKGMMFEHNLDKLVKLLENVEEVQSLSNRQLAVILSAFGDVCDTCPRAKRQALFEKALRTLEQNGTTLDLLSTNAVLEVKLSNLVQINALEEMQKLQAAGIDPDEKTYALLAQVYANNGESKAVADILTHMKQSGIAVGEDHAAAMVYSVARGGNESHVDLVIQKFASSFNVVRLRCTAAQAIISRSANDIGKGGYEASEQLRKIPTTSKIQTLDNNRYVLNVLMDLIEAGQQDAFALISPYLILNEDGTALGERNNNNKIVSRAKCILGEGKIAEALNLYSVVHPNYQNEFFENSVKSAIRNEVKTVSQENLEGLLRTITVAQRKGIISNPDEFILSAGLESPSFGKIFEHVKNNGNLRNTIADSPHIKLPLAKHLGHKLVTTPSPMEKAKYLADIATVLFIPSEEETLNSLLSYYAILHKMGANDVKLPLLALEQINDNYVKREYTTAVIHELLRSLGGDHLAFDKLKAFCESKHVTSVFTIRLQRRLVNLIRSKDGQPVDEGKLKVAAKICALDFGSDAKFRVSFSAKNLATIFANELVSDQTVNSLVELLENEPNVSLSSEELSIAKEVLKDCPKKAEAIARLKKSQTFLRWKTTDLDELIKEANSLKDSKDIKPAVLKAIRELIVNRALSEKRNDVEYLLNVIEQVSNWNKDEEKSKKSSITVSLLKQLESTALSRALALKDVVLADRIWAAKSQQLHADVLLSYASQLYIDGHTERADQVCAELRSTAQPVLPSTLTKLGRNLKGCALEKLDSLSAYLKKQFNLPTSQTRRIAGQFKLELLQDLIQRDKLEEALKLALEETKATNRAFGQIPLMTEALRRNDRQLLEKVHVMVRSAHDLPVANVNLAYALIDAGYVDKAKDLVEKQSLKIEEGVLKYFITIAASASKADVLRGLFQVFNNNASTLQLNVLLESLTRIYWREERFDDLNSLKEEIEAASFPLQQKLRGFFENLKQKTTEIEA